MGGAQGASQDGDDDALESGWVVADALVDAEPVAQPGARPGEPVLQGVEVGGQRAEQDGDGHLSADDDLFEVEDFGA